MHCEAKYTTHTQKRLRILNILTFLCSIIYGIRATVVYTTQKKFCVVYVLPDQFGHPVAFMLFGKQHEGNRLHAALPASTTDRTCKVLSLVRQDMKLYQPLFPFNCSLSADVNTFVSDINAIHGCYCRRSTTTDPLTAVPSNPDLSILYCRLPGVPDVSSPSSARSLTFDLSRHMTSLGLHFLCLEFCPDTIP